MPPTRSASARRDALRFVVLPQALRLIVPPLTSQYLNLAKNSSLAVAIGYPDLVSIANTTMNQTGQAIEGVAIIMAVFLTISLSISAFMNWYNRRVALQGRARDEVAARQPVLELAERARDAGDPLAGVEAGAAVRRLGAAVDAVWRAPDPRACREAHGACWAFIGEKHRFILFGTYPVRAALAAGAGDG